MIASVFLHLTKDESVRFLQIALGTLTLSLLMAFTPGWAAPASAPEKAASASVSTSTTHTNQITIVPHRAIYDMALTSVKNGSNIIGVSGKMLFEWGDVCNGWAVQQHLRLHFTYSEGDESDVTSTELTWESKNGKQYTFNIRRMSDGKETERYVGKASLNDKGGTVTYTVPAKKEESLPIGTLFPSAHTKLILEKALSGEKIFSRRVFDGSDDEGSDDVSVFINPSEAHWQETDLNAKLKSNPLLVQPAWPVRMAFFKVDTETGEPDYEMNINLLANGVAQKMMIDYGDFSVTGTLTDIEPLPATCS